MHLQLCNREWVLWSYAPRTENQPRFACNISPSHSTINGIDLPFTLPVSYPNAMEYERIVTWGWRLRDKNELETTKWRLADSREACVEAARKFVSYTEEHQPVLGRRLRIGLGDIREHAGGIL